MSIAGRSGASRRVVCHGSSPRALPPSRFAPEANQEDRGVKAAKGVRLDAARVVRDASVSGELVLTERQITGTLRLTCRGTAHGSLRIQLTAKGASHATGTLDGRRVSLSFRVGG
jgi:hypothetical protein